MPLSVVVQNFDCNAQETEAEGSMSPRAAWGTWKVPGQPGDT